MSAGHRYLLADVFATAPLEGNQLAVFPEADGLPAALMQRLALELKLSETVFVLAAEAGGDARLRIFTPAAELPFAGHPVLGSAIVLAAERGLERLVLETGAGPVQLGVTLTGERAGEGTMLQPLPRWRAFEREAELLAALGLTRSLLPVEAYTNGPTHVYVALDGQPALSALAPDMRALSALGEIGVSCVARAGRAFATRVFAPALGVDEDPATGSAAGPLAVHLARHRWAEFGRQIEIRQGAELGRPSLLLATAVGSGEALERVEVAGAAVIVARGEFFVP